MHAWTCTDDLKLQTDDLVGDARNFESLDVAKIVSCCYHRLMRIRRHGKYWQARILHTRHDSCQARILHKRHDSCQARILHRFANISLTSPHVYVKLCWMTGSCQIHSSQYRVHSVLRVTHKTSRLHIKYDMRISSRYCIHRHRPLMAYTDIDPLLHTSIPLYLAVSPGNGASMTRIKFTWQVK